MSLRMRRGGAIAAPPPPDEIFGPTLGVQTVRDQAAPQTVTKPLGAVDVAVGSFTQTTLNARGIGAIMWLLPGTHNAPSALAPLTNQQIWAANATVIDGNSNASDYLVKLGDAGATGIQIHGGVWQNQGNGFSPGYATAFMVGFGAVGGNHLIQDATVINNFNNGIRVQNRNCTIRRCKANSNGRYGISCSDNVNGDFASDNIVVENCEIAFNNTRHLDPGDDASATKFIPGRYGRWSSNWCHDNYGFGMWWDGPNQELTIEENVSENNQGGGFGGGFFYEIAYGGSVIRHNYAKGNGTGVSPNYPFNTVQMIVSCAPADGVRGTAPGNAVRNEIHNNDFDSGAGTYDTPLVLLNHSAHAADLLTRNFYVHHNRMWVRGVTGTSRTGLADATSGPPKAGDIGTSPGVPGRCLFDFNEYHVADINGSYWEHDTTNNLSPGPRTFLAFQSRGHEAHGTVVTL